jgi:hypothetical protein
MTGRYSIREGLSLILVPGGGSNTLSQRSVTMAQLFKSQGYDSIAREYPTWAITTAALYSIRDYFVPPDPGVYGGLYNYGYRTERINDNNGNKITTGPLGLTTFDVDVNMYALAPMVAWVAPWNFLGARYGAFISPSFLNSSLDANINTALGRGGSVNQSSFGVGDLFVQAVWLD